MCRVLSRTPPPRSLRVTPPSLWPGFGHTTDNRFTCYVVSLFDCLNNPVGEPLFRQWMSLVLSAVADKRMHLGNGLPSSPGTAVNICPSQHCALRFWDGGYSPLGWRQLPTATWLCCRGSSGRFRLYDCRGSHAPCFLERWVGGPMPLPRSLKPGLTASGAPIPFLPPARATSLAQQEAFAVFAYNYPDIGTCASHTWRCVMTRVDIKQPSSLDIKPKAWVPHHHPTVPLHALYLTFGRGTEREFPIRAMLAAVW